MLELNRISRFFQSPALSSRGLRGRRGMGGTSKRSIAEPNGESDAKARWERSGELGVAAGLVSPPVAEEAAVRQIAIAAVNARVRTRRIEIIRSSPVWPDRFAGSRSTGS
jgi:hypothetical protein